MAVKIINPHYGTCINCSGDAIATVASKGVMVGLTVFLLCNDCFRELAERVNERIGRSEV